MAYQARAAPSAAAQTATGMSREEMWRVLADAKALAEEDPKGMEQMLERFPALAGALVAGLNKLGIAGAPLAAEASRLGVGVSAPATVSAPMAPARPVVSYAPPPAAAVVPASVRAKKPLLGGMAPPPPPGASSSSSSSARAAPHAAPADPRFADPRLADPRLADPRLADPRLAAAPPADPRLAGGDGGDGGGDRAVIEQLLSMSASDVAALAPAEQEQVRHVRDALLLPISAIQGMPAQRRDELLRTRTELQGVLGVR